MAALMIVLDRRLFKPIPACGPALASHPVAINTTMNTMMVRMPASFLGGTPHRWDGILNCGWRIEGVHTNSVVTPLPAHAGNVARGWRTCQPSQPGLVRSHLKGEYQWHGAPLSQADWALAVIWSAAAALQDATGGIRIILLV